MSMRIRYHRNARRSPCFTKVGPGRRHHSGPVRQSIAMLPEFGADKKGIVIAELPVKYAHSHAAGHATPRTPR